MISVVFKSGHPLGRIRVEFGWLHGAPAAPQAVRVLLWRDDFIARPAARAAGAAKICCARRGRAVATEVQCISDSVNTSAHPEARGKTAKRAKRARGRMTHQPPQLRTIEDPPTVGALLLLFEPPCPPLTPGMTAPGTTRLVPLNPGVTTAGATPGASAAALRAPGTPPLPPMPIVPRYGARNVPPTCSTLVSAAAPKTARPNSRRASPSRSYDARGLANDTPRTRRRARPESDGRGAHGGARDERQESLWRASQRRGTTAVRYSVAGETRLTRRAGPHVSLLVSVVCVCHASRVTRVDANGAIFYPLSRTFFNFYKTVRFNFRT